MSDVIKTYDKYKSGLRVNLYSDKLIIVKPEGIELRPYTDIKKGFKIARWLNVKLFNEGNKKDIPLSPSLNDKTKYTITKTEYKDKPININTPAIYVKKTPFNKDVRVLNESQDKAVYMEVNGVKKDITDEILKSPNKRKTSDKKTCGYWNLKKPSRLSPSIKITPINTDDIRDEGDLKEALKVYESNILKASKKFNIISEDEDKTILEKDFRHSYNGMRSLLTLAKPKISLEV